MVLPLTPSAGLVSLPSTLPLACSALPPTLKKRCGPPFAATLTTLRRPLSTRIQQHHSTNVRTFIGVWKTLNSMRLLAKDDFGGTVSDAVGPLMMSTLSFPLHLSFGDTEMHDKLCGKTLNRSATAQCLCCHCKSPLEQSINPDHPRNPFKKATFDRQNANDACFKSMSHHPHLVNAFHSIDTGENTCNAHLASPREALHANQKGMMM